MSFKQSSVIFVSLAVGLVSTEALAQEVGAGGTVTTQTTVTTQERPVAAPATTTTTTTTPTTPRLETGIVDDTSADHDKVVGHLGVTYFGVSSIPVAAVNAAGTPDRVLAPAIGVRYWLNRSIGIDAGLGLGLASGSRETVSGGTTVTTDSPSRFGMLIHGGVPIALAAGKHYTFEVIPELNIGFASGTIKGTGNTPAPDISLSGLKLDLGARIGGEIHFGFIGIPELALQASVGLFVRRESWKASQTVNGATQSDASSVLGFATTVNGEPWAIFANNISAIYYF